MAITITKKTKTILVIVLGVLVLFTSGFLIWRVTQEETVAPDDADAAAQCNTPGTDKGCLCSCGADKKKPLTTDRCNYECCTAWFGDCGCHGWGDKYSCSEYGKCGTLDGKSFDHTVTGWPSGTFCEKDRGTLSSTPSFPQQGKSVTWKCEGKGQTVNCSASRKAAPEPDPKCGSYKKTYAPGDNGWGNGAFCNPGTPDPSRSILEKQFPGVGDKTDWRCSSGGKHVSCTATRADWDDPLCGDMDGKTFQPGIEAWPSNNFCKKGTPDPSKPSFPPLGGETAWQCVEGTKKVDCGATRVDWGEPVCGSLHDQTFSYEETSWPSDDFCGLGTPNPSTPEFPASGSSTEWKCVEGTKEVSCTASRTSMAEKPTNGGEVPQTNIFATVLGRITFGFSFIILGGLVSQYSKINYLYNSVVEKQRFKKEIRKESKMFKKRDKLERRFKK